MSQCQAVAVDRAFTATSVVTTHRYPGQRTLTSGESIVRRALHASPALSPADRQNRDQLIKRFRREQARLQWEFLQERRPAAPPGCRPNPTEEATRIWHLEPTDKSKPMMLMKLLCGECPTTRARPPVGEVFATAHGSLLVAIYGGPNSKGTEWSGSLRRFRTGQWLDCPPRAFAARCGRCGRTCIDSTGRLVAEVRDRVDRIRQGEKDKKLWVVDGRYYLRKMETPGL